MDSSFCSLRKVLVQFFSVFHKSNLNSGDVLRKAACSMWNSLRMLHVFTLKHAVASWMIDF